MSWCNDAYKTTTFPPATIICVNLINPGTKNYVDFYLEGAILTQSLPSGSFWVTF
ncbi:hypothetical protein HanXRQr2_Chr10g0465611 [Helianthus annuus]|uniref:Uncharacterized protein n=1 Tax=Helianthus annuus TaxID=4232 RepID=A0A9K3N5Y0_HELAN|nr:hypothetical protein HanXRQr2_Chr10g0465611 [Helianthus annuus]